MKIIFSRHGESYANTERVISNTMPTHGLTRTGRQQAKQLASLLQSSRVTGIYSSPVLRAIETTALVADLLDLDYRITDALREFDCGIFEGRSDQAAWDMMRDLHQDWAIHHLWNRRLEGGESAEDIRKRFVPFVDNLITQFHATDKIILCIGHGGMYRIALPTVLANIDYEQILQLEIVNCTRIYTEILDGNLSCTNWNGVEM